jgi:hypothetical protein
MSVYLPPGIEYITYHHCRRSFTFTPLLLQHNIIIFTISLLPYPQLVPNRGSISFSSVQKADFRVFLYGNGILFERHHFPYCREKRNTTTKISVPRKERKDSNDVSIVTREREDDVVQSAREMDETFLRHGTGQGKARQGRGSGRRRIWNICFCVCFRP